MSRLFFKLCLLFSKARLNLARVFYNFKVSFIVSNFEICIYICVCVFLYTVYVYIFVGIYVCETIN